MHDLVEPQPEQLLNRWLAEQNEVLGRDILGSLITLHAEPVIRRIVSSKLGANGGAAAPNNRTAADVADVCHEAIGSLLSHLDKLKNNLSDEEPPRNFKSYVAVTAFNACNEYLRKRSPARHALSTKLRYLLRHDSKFALWQFEDGKEVAGLADMRTDKPASATAVSHVVEQLPPQGAKSLFATVDDVFRIAKKPVVFDILLEIVAQATSLREPHFVSSNIDSSDGKPRHSEQLVDNHQPIDVTIHRHEYLLRVWKEICDLSLEQRSALLLNLKDSTGGDIQLFDWLGIAGIEQIAAILHMDPIRFAALWKELPLEDNRIAAELGITRQDVINRRSSARHRLLARMKGY